MSRRSEPSEAQLRALLACAKHGSLTRGPGTFHFLPGQGRPVFRQATIETLVRRGWLRLEAGAVVVLTIAGGRLVERASRKSVKVHPGDD